MGNYIPLSEFKKRKKADPLVCSVCGNEQGEQCCAAIHCAEEATTWYNPSPVVMISCSCPKCTPRY